MSAYPALEYLCKGYLNEDWPEEYGDVWHAVTRFVQEEPERALILPAEIDDLLHQGLSDDGLAALLHDELWCAYSPSPGGRTYSTWLREVAEQVAHESRSR